jgi:hypothetical protein
MSPTMKALFYVMLAVVLSLPCLSRSEQQPAAAWWLDMSFTPDQETLNGVPVVQFSKDWKKAKLLSVEDLKGRISNGEFKEFLGSGFTFKRRLERNENRARVDAYVGVYESQDGTKGRFLAILHDQTPIKVFRDGAVPGFSALRADHNVLRWYRCMQCSDFDTLRWTGKAYVLE